jgi:uncharacterized membrane protein YdjX (TVP38/TMEM64 family)
MKSGYGRWLTVAAMLLAVLGAGVFCGGNEPCRVWIRVLDDRELLQNILGKMGPWAPLIIALAEMLQVILAPVPGQIVGIVAGYLYGVLWGTLLCMVGLAIGSLAAMWLARQLGRPLVERIAGPDLVRRIDGYVDKRGAFALFLIFLLPFLPDDSVCFIAGMTRLRLTELLLLAIIGRLPGLVVSTLIGAQVHDLTSLQLLVIVAVSILLALCFFLYQDRLEQLMFRLLDRFHRG